MSTVYSILLAALFAGLGELVLHWFPWRMLLGRDLPAPLAYVTGVLAFLLPYLVLLWAWAVPLQVILAAIIIVCSAGAAVWGAYGLDWLLGRIRLAHELEEILDGQGALDE